MTGLTTAGLLELRRRLPPRNLREMVAAADRPIVCWCQSTTCGKHYLFRSFTGCVRMNLFMLARRSMPPQPLVSFGQGVRLSNLPQFRSCDLARCIGSSSSSAGAMRLTTDGPVAMAWSVPIASPTLLERAFARALRFCGCEQ